MPTGGKITYEFGSPSSQSNVSASGVYQGQARFVYRRVKKRRVFLSASVEEGYTEYGDPVLGSGESIVTVSHKSPGATLAQEKHYFYGNPAGSVGGAPWGYSAWKVGRERRGESVLKSDGTTVLRATEHVWAQRAASTWYPFNNAGSQPDSAPPIDPRITQTTTTWNDAALVAGSTAAQKSSIRKFTYDQYNNQTGVTELGFDAVATIRSTTTSYVTDANYTGEAMHLLSLVALRQSGRLDHRVCI